MSFFDRGHMLGFIPKGRIDACRRVSGKENGAAAIEFALMLPILVVMLFGVVDFGRFVHARLVITNLSREGGNLASRDIKSGDDLIAMLQSSSGPLDLKNERGRICISRVDAGTDDEDGSIEPRIGAQFTGGSLDVSCTAGSVGDNPAGLGEALYKHLVYDEEKKTSDLGGLTVVEVFYKYTPITPLPGFIASILLKDGDGTIIGSRAVF
jgi:hypothetical protein